MKSAFYQFGDEFGIPGVSNAAYKEGIYAG